MLIVELKETMLDFTKGSRIFVYKDRILKQQFSDHKKGKQLRYYWGKFNVKIFILQNKKM